MNEIATADVEIIDPKQEIIMSRDEAEGLTKSIQSTASALYILLKKAHDEKAYISLGYKTWSEYIDGEFDFSRTRSYQLINQANVIEEINQAGGVELFITEREARSIKSKLPEITEKLKEVKEANLPKEKAEEKVKEVIEESKETEHSSEIDMAKRPKKQSDDDDEDSFNEDTSPGGKEWTPAPIDKILKDDDLFYYNNLMTTLKVFESMPDAAELGRTLNHSTKDTKELIQKAEKAFAWLTRIMDEIE